MLSRASHCAWFGEKMALLPNLFYIKTEVGERGRKVLTAGCESCKHPSTVIGSVDKQITLTKLESFFLTCKAVDFLPFRFAVVVEVCPSSAARGDVGYRGRLHIHICLNISYFYSYYKYKESCQKLKVCVFTCTRQSFKRGSKLNKISV